MLFTLPLFLHTVVQFQWKRGKRKLPKNKKGNNHNDETKTTSDLEELFIRKEFTAWYIHHPHSPKRIPADRSHIRPLRTNTHFQAQSKLQKKENSPLCSSLYSLLQGAEPTFRDCKPYTRPFPYTVSCHLHHFIEDTTSISWGFQEFAEDCKDDSERAVSSTKLSPSPWQHHTTPHHSAEKMMLWVVWMRLCCRDCHRTQ